jgi:cellulose synthase/poly-beta-1,6-N-acetylglucosamine synthase-like glycosyltransferase
MSADVLCGPWPTFFAFAGALWVFAMALAQLVIAIPRYGYTKSLRNSRRLEAARAPSSGATDAAQSDDAVTSAKHAAKQLPKVAVVMPVKGVHAQSYHNWQTQINSHYGGALEFHFCIESEDDPAYPHIRRLIQEYPGVNIQLHVAGVSWHCSQKIHNQLYGFELAMCSCEYVLVVDDDIQLHPNSIQEWVEVLSSDPQVLAASGYAFEYVPSTEQGWSSYFAMLWRLAASAGFNQKDERPVNCWGGALMFRSSELRANIYGLKDAWLDGGYSEDFITLTLAR